MKGVARRVALSQVLAKKTFFRFSVHNRTFLFLSWVSVINTPRTIRVVLVLAVAFFHERQFFPIMSFTERFFWRRTKCVNNLESRLEKYFRLKEPQCLSAVSHNSPSLFPSSSPPLLPPTFLSRTTWKLPRASSLPFNIFLLHSELLTAEVPFHVVFWIAAIRVATFSFLPVVEAASCDGSVDDGRYHQHRRCRRRSAKSHSCKNIRGFLPFADSRMEGTED